MRNKRTLAVYGMLAGAWLIVGLWQALEYTRVKKSAREALTDRARDISYSLSAVIRAQSWFGRVRQPRLEASLTGLAQSEELVSVALLNAAGQVVASAGQPLDFEPDEVPSAGAHWGRKTVTFVNLIDLGADTDGEGTTRPAPIIVDPDKDEGRPDRRRGPPRPRRVSVERTSESVIMVMRFSPDAPTTGPDSVLRQPGDGRDRDDRDREGRGRDDRDRDDRERDDRDRDDRDRGRDRFPTPLRRSVEKTSEAVIVRLVFPADVSTTGPGSFGDPDRHRRDSGRRRRPPRPFGRPPWMSQEHYTQLLQKQGLHGFVLVMSANQFRAESARDLGLRLMVMGIALVAVFGLGLAWRNLERSAQLQVRLVRASEMNAHLREMNVAAAGLAHEIRNPLNIVRGLAQMVSQRDDTSPEIRQRTRDITEEVDRVTGRLNEFIDYSRPREAKPAPTNLSAVARDVERALESDKDEKNVQFALDGPELIVEADESLMRQVLFNLMLNAIQAVDRGGRVGVVVERTAPGEAAFEIQDNGPGVPVSAREDIFRPYYTTHEGGTGLGLAIVRQIVLAHGWDIEYVPNADQGARFRVSGLKVVSRTP